MRKVFRIGLALFIIFLLLDIYLLIDSKFFNIQSISVELENISCSSQEEIVIESKLLGQSIFTINDSDLERNLKEKYLCIKSVRILSELPNKISLKVSGRIPAAILVEVATPSATSLVVDEEGVIYSTGSEVPLPKIIFSGKLNLGQTLQEGLVKNSLKILQSLKEISLAVNEARIQYPTTLALDSQPKLLFDLDKDINIQLASLQLILEQAKIEDKEMDFVDLRFDNPIVKFKKGGDK